MTFGFSMFRSAFDAQGTVVEVDWQEFCGLIQDKGEVDVRSVKDGPGLVLGELDGGYRQRDNCLVMYAVGLDLDPRAEDTPESWQDALSAALSALEPYEYLVWTTYSSTPEKPRLRVLVPLQQPTDADGYDAAWATLAGLCPDGVCDRRARDASRFHYLPAVPTKEALGWFAAEHHPGERFSAPAHPAPLSPTQTIKTELPLSETRLRASLVKDWLVSRSSALTRVREVAKAVALGEVFGQEGGRHEAALHLTAILASQYRPKNSSDPEPTEVIREVFRDSVETMKRQQVDVPSLDSIVQGYEGAVQKFAKDAKVQMDTSGQYTASELFDISQRQGLPSPTALSRRWAVAHRDAYFFLAGDGDYRGPYMGESKDVAMLQALKRAPVALYTHTPNGKRLRTAKDVLADAGTVVRDEKLDMAAQVTTVDGDCIRIAPCPRRQLPPEYNADIDQWLRLLSGSCYPKLVDWLSVLPDLDQMLCALYFDGAPGTGKTLFAQGIASIWSDSVTKFGDFQSTFNASVARCPVVFADEEVENDRFKRSSATTLIREMITTKQRTINEKNRPLAELFGAIRLILAANSDALLTWKDAASAHDLEAIGQRILYIAPQHDAADFLLAQGKETCNMWQRHGLAQHVLWLHENHTVANPGGRLAVEGDISRLHRTMLTGSKVTSEVIEILVRHLLDPRRLRATEAPIARREGELLVNVDALRIGWVLLDRKHENPPSTTLLGRALRTIAKDEAGTRRLNWGKRRLRVVAVDVEHLVAWAEHQSVASREELMESLQDEDWDDENDLAAAEAENDLDDPV